MKDRLLHTLKVLYAISIMAALFMAFGASLFGPRNAMLALGFLAYVLLPFILNLVMWIVKGKGFL